MSIIDSIGEYELEARSRNGITIKIIKGNREGEYHVTIPYDSGLAYTTISGSLQQCYDLVWLLMKMDLFD